MTDTQNLATLEELLMQARTICQSRHAVGAGINLQLQAALTSIRQGRPEDAIRYIERAIDIEGHWAGSTLHG